MDDIRELRARFAGLEFSQKKEFIMNMKKKLEGANSPTHSKFLEECISEYNTEVRERNKKAGFEPKPMPDISPDTFARALATMVYGGAEKIAAKPHLIGKWQREPDEGD